MANKRVSYLGEATGDNMQVTPEQLLDMIRNDLPEYNASDRPVKGLFAIVVREDEDGDLFLTYYRCQLPKFVEVAVLTRTFGKVCADEDL